MSESEAILKQIEGSLRQPKAKPSSPRHSAFKAKLDRLEKLDPSLFTLFRFVNEVVAYIDGHKHEAAVVDGVAKCVAALDVKIDGNLSKIDQVQSELRTQINTQVSKRLMLMEAKQQRMIERVDGVLQELERVLRQM